MAGKERKHKRKARSCSKEEHRLLFENNPYPMWVYDLETLSFLEVNEAAVNHYGYSRDEFLGMTMKDIRAPEGIPAFVENASVVIKGPDAAGVWRHQKKDGSIMFVEITSHTLSFEGRKAELVIANDITERRQIEERLMQSEEKYRDLIEKIQDGVFIFQDGEIQFANKAFARMAGYTVEEIIGMDLRALVAPEDFEMVGERYRRRIAGEKIPSEYQISALHKDGKTRISVILNVGLINYRGRAATMGTVKDITERQRAEEKLRLFRNLIDQSNDAIFVSDPETGRILDVNYKACKNLGYTREELLDKRVFDFEAVIPDQFSWMDHVKEVREKEYILLEGQHRRKDGTAFPVEVNVNMIVIGKNSYMVAVVRDITRRKMAEEAVRSAEAKFRSLVEQSLVGTYITQDKEILYVNPKLAEMLGYTQDEIISSKSVSDLIVEDDRYTAIENIRKRLRGDVQSIQHTFRGRRKDGTLIDLEVYGTRAEINRKPVVIGTALDITERRQTEKMLKEKARGELYGFIVSALPVFASGVSSHVRTTLVRNFAERFEKNVKPRFEEEMRRLGNRKIEDRQEILGVFILWLTELFSNLGIQTRTTSKATKAEIEFSNCPWAGEARDNAIYCFICRTIVMRSFTWTSLRGSADQRYSIANGSDTCRFEIHILSILAEK